MAIAAVFIALALGMLIGVSFGDSFLVANQRDVIQLMEGQLEQLRESGRRQEIELQRWAALQPLFRRFFDGALAGQKIFIVAPPGEEAAALRVLLEEAGAAAAVVPAPGSEEGGPEPSGGEAEALAAMLAEPARMGFEQAAGTGPPLPGEGSPSLEKPPDCCLLLVEAAAYFSGDYFEALRVKLQEHDLLVILLFPWREEESPRLLAGAGPELNLVDNIDTVWGQIALLQMIAENVDGHYGFAKGSAGLFPEQARGR